MKYFSLSLLVLSFLTFGPLRADEKAAEPAAKGTPAAAPATGGSKFQGEDKKLYDYLVDLFETSKHVSGKENEKSRNKIEAALDWDKIAQDCLGTHWKTQSPANREAFKKILREVITKTAFSRMESFWSGTTYDIDKIEKRGAETFVSSKFKVKSDTFSLEYYLNKKGGKSLITDIAFEDLRYSESIREQIEAFLKEKKFSDLMEKLKKRRDELDKGVKSNASGASLK